MMLREEFLGAMMALFTGLVLPERESILVRPSWHPATFPGWSPTDPFLPVLTTEQIEAAMKVIFAKPISEDIANDPELMAAIETDWGLIAEDVLPGDVGPRAYIEQGHFWTLPCGPGWEMIKPP